MNGKFMKIGGIVLMVASLLGAAYAFDKRYMPREVTDMRIADVQKNQMLLNKTGQRQNALNWLLFWQIKVARLTGECAAMPSDTFRKNELKEAIKIRDNWQSEVNRLMQP